MNMRQAASIMALAQKISQFYIAYYIEIIPRGDAGGLSREYVLRIPSVS